MTNPPAIEQELNCLPWCDLELLAVSWIEQRRDLVFAPSGSRGVRGGVRGPNDPAKNAEGASIRQRSQKRERQAVSVRDFESDERGEIQSPSQGALRCQAR
jgi:hypothetical protein